MGAEMEKFYENANNHCIFFSWPALSSGESFFQIIVLWSGYEYLIIATTTIKKTKEMFFIYIQRQYPMQIEQSVNASAICMLN